MDVRVKSSTILGVCVFAIGLLSSACTTSAVEVDPPVDEEENPTDPPPPDDPPSTDTQDPYPIHVDSTDMDAPETYKGLPLQLTINAAPTVSPVEGLIGVVCIGMSNASQECGELIDQATGPWSADIDPSVTIVNCARDGHAIERWIDPSFDDVLWDDCVTRLANSGLEPKHVRVVLHKAANQFTTAANGQLLPPYPDPDADYFNLIDNLDLFAQRVATELPDVAVVFTTTRSYAGFSTQPARGDPVSYEQGHALNTWLEDNPDVGGIAYAWGPYIWAPECSTGVTNGLGLCYARGDFEADGIHPSSSGEAMIAEAWHEHLLDQAWYRR